MMAFCFVLFGFLRCRSVVSMDVGLSEVIGQIPLLSVAWRGVAEHSVCNFVSVCDFVCVCLLVCCFLYLLCFLVGWYSPEGAVVIVVAVVGIGTVEQQVRRILFHIQFEHIMILIVIVV